MIHRMAFSVKRFFSRPQIDAPDKLCYHTASMYIGGRGMIRLIATDLDGTLLEPDGTLPDGTYEAVEELTLSLIHI